MSNNIPINDPDFKGVSSEIKEKYILAGTKFLEAQSEELEARNKEEKHNTARRSVAMGFGIIVVFFNIIFAVIVSPDLVQTYNIIPPFVSLTVITVGILAAVFSKGKVHTQQNHPNRRVRGVGGDDPSLGT